jgi:formylglycine-generating enzyme required for sulfatase activity
MNTKKRTFRLRLAAWLGLGLAVSAGVAAIGLSGGNNAHAESPIAPAGGPPAGELKSFTQSVPGTTVSFDMVAISGGKFKMGSPDSEKKRKADEGPQLDVTVEPFYLGKYEVTWDLYNEYLETYSALSLKKNLEHVPAEKIADAISYPTPIYDIEAGPALQRMGGRTGDLPAVIMSHYAAKQFTKWLSAKTGRFYRLPTEAEWEYAARAGTNTAYSFGDDPKQLKEYGWFMDNSELKDGDPGYHPVGQKKPNPWGLYDMYGNVAEIVFDQYDPEQYKQFAGKPVSAHDIIRWPDKQYPRTARGGGFESEADQCRSAARQKITVADNTKDPQNPKSPYWLTQGFSIGFRLCSPAKEPTDAEKHKFWDVDNEPVKDIMARDREIRQWVKDVQASTKPTPEKK